MKLDVQIVKLELVENGTQKKGVAGPCLIGASVEWPSADKPVFESLKTTKLVDGTPVDLSKERVSDRRLFSITVENRTDLKVVVSAVFEPSKLEKIANEALKAALKAALASATSGMSTIASAALGSVGDNALGALFSNEKVVIPVASGSLPIDPAAPPKGIQRLPLTFPKDITLKELAGVQGNPKSPTPKWKKTISYKKGDSNGFLEVEFV